MANKDRRTYTVVIITSDNTLKSAFSGYFTECTDIANILIDKYNWPKNKIEFIDNETYEIVNIKHLMQKFYYREFGSFGKFLLEQDKKLMPWDKGYKSKKE